MDKKILFVDTYGMNRGRTFAEMFESMDICLHVNYKGIDSSTKAFNRFLTQEDLDMYDAIFCMSSEQQMFIYRNYENINNCFNKVVKIGVENHYTYNSPELIRVASFWFESWENPLINCLCT